MAKLIVGLGNPGPKYIRTKHNVGFMVIDELADAFNMPGFQSKLKGEFTHGIVDGEKVYLLKPQTFMNLSGECVIPFMDYFNIDDEDLIVIYDDLDIPLGQLRLREKGSAGGHNGMKSIISYLGHQNFKRIRFGIGRPQYGTVVDYVLSGFHSEQHSELEDAIKQASLASKAFISSPFLQVMNDFNRKV